MKKKSWKCKKKFL